MATLPRPLGSASPSIVFSVRAETLPLTLRALRRLIAETAGICGAAPLLVDDLEIALGEILGNVQRHAYHGDVGPVEVDVRCDEHSAEIVVHDHGELLVRAPRVPTVPPVGDVDGVGLYLAQQLVDTLEIAHPARDERGTSVRLVKRF